MHSVNRSGSENMRSISKTAPKCCENAGKHDILAPQQTIMRLKIILKIHLKAEFKEPWRAIDVLFAMMMSGPHEKSPTPEELEALAATRV